MPMRTMTDSTTNTPDEANVEYDHPIVKMSGEATESHPTVDPGHKPDDVTLIRTYSPIPSQQLYAYQVNGSDKHTVVLRGDDPGQRWVKQVPTTRSYPIPTEKLWTIPENWEPIADISHENIAYGIWYIKDSDVYVECSIPIKDHAVDAWYGVKKVGGLTAYPITEIGGYYDVKSCLETRVGEIEDSASEEHITLEMHITDAILNNLTDLKVDVKEGCQWVISEGMAQSQDHNGWCHLDENRIYESKYNLFRPYEIITSNLDPDNIDVDGVDEQTFKNAVKEAINHLRENDLYPPAYRAEIDVAATNLGMEYYTDGLIEAGCEPAEVLDYYAVEIQGRSQTDQAERRGKDQTTVSRNVSRAKETLENQ